MVNALKDMDGNVRYTVYPEAKHDSWCYSTWFYAICDKDV
jgi:hypothetical protein